MSDNNEWSEWFLHDGRGCPVEGHYVKVEGWAGRSGAEVFGRASGVARKKQYMWTEETLSGPKIIRYRVRKPRALQQLRDMVENLPADATEDALT